MVWLWIGNLAFAASAGGFWYSLPVNGQVRPFVNTLVEPYVAIALAGGFVMGIGSFVRGVADLWF
jgi:hypothetical protein